MSQLTIALTKEQKKEINDEFKEVFKKRNETPEGIAINIIQTLEYKYNKKTMAAIRGNKYLEMSQKLVNCEAGNYDEVLIKANCAWLVAPMKYAAGIVREALATPKGFSATVSSEFRAGIPVLTFNRECDLLTVSSFLDIIFALYLQRYGAKEYGKQQKAQGIDTQGLAYVKNSDNTHSMKGKDLEMEQRDEFFTSKKGRGGKKQRYLTTMFISTENGLKQVLPQNLRIGLAPLVKFKIIPPILSGVQFALEDVYKNTPGGSPFIGSFTFSKTKAKFSLKKNKPNPFNGDVPSATWLGKENALGHDYDVIDKQMDQS